MRQLEPVPTAGRGGKPFKGLGSLLVIALILSACAEPQATVDDPPSTTDPVTTSTSLSTTSSSITLPITTTTTTTVPSTSTTRRPTTTLEPLIPAGLIEPEDGHTYHNLPAPVGLGWSGPEWPYYAHLIWTPSPGAVSEVVEAIGYAEAEATDYEEDPCYYDGPTERICLDGARGALLGLRPSPQDYQWRIVSRHAGGRTVASETWTFHFLVYSEYFTIEGHVKDASTNNPIQSATVTYTDGYGTRQAATDVRGWFGVSPGWLQGKEPIESSVTFEAEGFEPIEMTLSADAWGLEVLLTPIE